MLFINLRMTLKIQKDLRTPPAEPSMTTMEQGQRVPFPKGEFLQSRNKIRLQSNGQAAVFLFLSSRCPKCREKLPELESLLPVANSAGLNMWIISYEPRARLHRFIEKSTLQRIVFRTGILQYRALNPTFASPFYLFVNHEDKLEAAGMIGDQNWLAFQSQLESIKIEIGAVG